MNIKSILILTVPLMLFWQGCGSSSNSSDTTVVTMHSPDSLAVVNVIESAGNVCYNVSYNGFEFIKDSRIGINTDLGDFSKDIYIKNVEGPLEISGNYEMRNSKKSHIEYQANLYNITFGNDSVDLFKMQWHLQNNDIAYRYEILPLDYKLVARIYEENTEFTFPEETTTYLSEMSAPMEGWNRTYPSYETYYEADMPMNDGLNKEYGFIFPALFRLGENGWVQLSETGVGSNYSGSRLKYKGDSTYQFAFPDEREFNGNGSAQPGISLPGYTPWRTITFGHTPAPLAETTIQFDLVEPLYDPSQEYQYGKGSWTWIMYDDSGTTLPVQREYVDFSHDMGYQTVLVDANWDRKIGRDSIAMLAKEAAEKDVALFMWYNSNGYWNDAPLTPRDIMDNTIRRRQEMKWLKDIGVRGVKVDFFGSDKQETMKLYEDILTDANDYGLMVIFHGSTMPRGWEKMYPNYISSEAVRASENLRFTQEECDREAYNATFHPVSRNAMGAMDFGGSTLNRYYNPEDVPGSSQRITSDVFALATAVLFQSAVQHFAMTPKGNKNAPVWAVDFMKAVPTTWDDVRWVAGTPGKNVVMARRNGDTWYIAGINAEETPFSFEIPADILNAGTSIDIYSDDSQLKGSFMTTDKNNLKTVEIPKNGGFVAMVK